MTAPAEKGWPVPARENRLTQRELAGYAMGDLGGSMTFAITGSFLTTYYNEVAGLSMAAISGIYLILRIWDGISNPGMGMLMDGVYARGGGRREKFLPWMRLAAPLLFISGILVFSLPGVVPVPARAAAAFGTYLLYGLSYTMFNIPYGSLLSNMSDTEDERVSLSTARGIGATIGNLIPLALFPLVLNWMPASASAAYAGGAAVCSAMGLAACLLCCGWTRERVGAPGPMGEPVHWRDMAITLRCNRPLAAICLIGLLFCVNQYMTSTLSVYMFRDVLGAMPMMSVMTTLSMGSSAASLLVAPKAMHRFRLKNTLGWGALIGVALMGLNYLCLVLWRSLWLYILLSVLSSCFSNLMALMQWGMIGEAIDYNEQLTGKRTEGAIYGVFNLLRRAGQAIGASSAVALLGVMGYAAGAAEQSDAVVLGIEAMSVLLPAMFVLLCWAVLRFMWNTGPTSREQAGSR